MINGANQMNNIMRSICDDCLVLPTCDISCDKVESKIQNIEIHLESEFALDIIINKHHCPICGRNECSYYEDTHSTKQNVMCCFCYYIYNIHLYKKSIELRNTRFHGNMFATKKTFKRYVKYLRDSNLTEGFIKYDMQ